MVLPLTLGFVQKQIADCKQDVADAQARLRFVEKQLWEIQHNCYHHAITITDMVVGATQISLRHAHCTDCDHVQVFYEGDKGYNNPTKHMQEADYP